MNKKGFNDARTNLRVAEEDSNKKIWLYTFSSIAGVLFIVLILIVAIGITTNSDDSSDDLVNRLSGTSHQTETTTGCEVDDDCIALDESAFCSDNGLCVIVVYDNDTGDTGDETEIECVVDEDCIAIDETAFCNDNSLCEIPVDDGDGSAGLTGFFAKFTGWVVDETGPIYYTGGNVGIGNSNPEVALEVTDNAPGNLSVFKASTNTATGSIGQTFNLVRSTDKYSGHQIYDQVRKISTTLSTQVTPPQLWRDYESKLQFGIANGRNGYIAQRYVDVLGTGAWQPSSMIFGNSKSVLPTASWNSVNNDYMIITYDGKVGIGTMNPVDFLQVKPGVNAGITLGSDNSGNPMLTFRSGASNNWKVTQYFTDGIQKWSMGSNLQDDFFLAPGAVGTPQLPVYIKVKQTSGAITFSNLSGAGSAYACINPAGTLYRSTTPCVA